MKNFIQFSPKVIALAFGVLVCLFLAVFYIFAWTEPTVAPPGGNVAVPLNTGSSAQTKTGDLTLPNLYLNAAGTEGNVYNLNWVVGYNDLYLKGNSAESAPVHIAGSQLSFWSSGEKWRIDSGGSLAIGIVPWARLTTFPAACSAGQYVSAVGATLTCSAPAGGVSGSGASGNTAFWTGASTLGSDSNFFWDNTNKRLGLGLTNPAYRLDISGDIRWSGTLQGGTVPWPRLASFPAACSAGQYVTAVGNTLTCATPAGGISGSGTANYIPVWTGGTSLGNSPFIINTGSTLPAPYINFNNYKLMNVREIDPIFNIDGKKYVSYLPDSIGQKVEVVGQSRLAGDNIEIDLAKEPTGSDLWLFWQVVDQQSIIPFVSSQNNAILYSYMDGSKLVVKLTQGEKDAKFSFRLIATRLDHAKDKSNLYDDQNVQSFIDIDSLRK